MEKLEGALTSQDEERHLVARCQQGDSQALAALVAKYQHRVYRMAFSLTRDPEEAFDLAQDTFLAVLAGIRRYRGASRLSTWIFSILHKRFQTHLRKKKRLKRLPEGLELPSEHKNPVEIISAVNEQQTMLQKLRSLPPLYREILIYFYFEEMDYAQIAQVLDCPIGTVKSRLHEARRKLRKAMGVEPT